MYSLNLQQQNSMNKSLEQVQEFHEVFGHRVGNINELEPLNVRQLRIKLLFEELTELAEASDCIGTMHYLSDCYSTSDYKQDGDNVNQLEELDALCDIQYVLNGKIITAGMQFIFDRELDKVHQNNMSKAHNSGDHARQTMEKLSQPGEIWSAIPYENYWIVTNPAGKIIKPHDHRKVELSLTPDL